MNNDKTKVLAFFGAFNPPTNAHIKLAKLAMEQTESIGVLLVPSKASYIIDKQKKSFAFSDEERLKMIHKLCEKNKWLDYAACDILSEEQPLTYDSLKWIKEEMKVNPSLLIGADQLYDMKENWVNVPNIAKEFGIVCLDRKAFFIESILEDPFWNNIKQYVKIIKTPQNMHWISSTYVRCELKKAQEAIVELKKDVPEEIFEYIKENYL